MSQAEASAVDRQKLLRDWVDLGSDAAGIGGGLLTFVEYVPGHEVGYTRWYEDDHFISGALAWPWVFAGRRWIATEGLKKLRFPVDSTLISPISRGTCLHAYLIAHGHIDDVQDLATLSLARLEGEGRMSRETPRKQVYTHFQDYLGARYASSGGPRDVHALNHPYDHLAMEIIEAATVEGRQALADWVLNERAPEILGRGYDMCLVFAPRRQQQLPGLSGAMQHYAPEFAATRIQVLWFGAGSPEAVFPEAFGDEQAAVAQSGLGRVQFAGPFIPAVTGTNRYIDE